MRPLMFFFTLLVSFGLPAVVVGECLELKILHREPFAQGKTFGEVGAYEKIVGVAKFAIDPSNQRNHPIVDLTLAPRNKDGKVEFASDFCILAPKDPAKGNGAVLYDVNNRGNKLALAFFNDAAGSNDPSTPEHAGNGFLMRHGFTIVWCGWIGELLPGQGRMLLQAPPVLEGGKPVRGIVRYEFGGDSTAESFPLSRRENHGSYPPTEKGEKEGVLTCRMRETDPRVVIPRSHWKLERKPIEAVKEGIPGTLPPIRVKLSSGFRAGYIYELICESEGAIVQGTGFAAVRDLLGFLKYDGTEKNPLARSGKSIITRVHGFGISQSGRFLRHLVYQGFNVDEKNRRVFDGLMPHVAGGGLGFFNHRFAQPTRHNGQHEDHLFPADLFPFTYGETKHGYFDPEGKYVTDDRIDGILRRLGNEDAKLLPKIMHTQSAAEYWHRSGSLVHTDPAGFKDVAIPESVRIYAFGGTQHGPAPEFPKPGNGDNLPNPGNFKPTCRALLLALDRWAKDNTPPPASAYPRIDDHTLVAWKQSGTHFPSLPGVRYPEVIQQPSYLDLGSDFLSKGIITTEPPMIRGHYRVLVPKSDTDGNDLGTLLPPEVAVPLATYTGWNLRKKEIGAEGMLLSLTGSFIPFPRTEAERTETGDPRVSIAQRYGTYENYLKLFRSKCEDYVRRGYLLQEDVERLIQGREKYRDWFPQK